MKRGLETAEMKQGRLYRNLPYERIVIEITVREEGDGQIVHYALPRPVCRIRQEK